MRKAQKYAIITDDQKLEIISLRRTGRKNYDICKLFRENYKIEIYEEQIDRIYYEYYKDYLGEPRYLIEVPDDDIYKLIKQGYSYRQVFEHLTGKGVKASKSGVERRCRDVLRRKAQINPRLKRPKVPYARIAGLRDEEGKTFEEITRILNEEGYEVSKSFVYNTYMSFRRDEKTLNELNVALNQELQIKRYLEEMISILKTYIERNLERE